MLKRRAKRRYLKIMHSGLASDAVATLAKRCSELFGSIVAEKAAIKLIKSEANMTIIKCGLEQLDSVLVAIAMSDPPMTTIHMSGSIKRLKRQH